jgi:hypothetical protein
LNREPAAGRQQGRAAAVIYRGTYQLERAMEKFKFELGADVAIGVSGESGEVIGRAEYLNNENSYFVRYKAGDGRAIEDWWRESALVSTDIQQGAISL